MNPLWCKIRGLSAPGLLRYLEILAPPICVVSICRDLGVRVSSEAMKEDGRVVIDRSKPFAHIHVPKEACLHRMRFTIAHELGHIMLHNFTTPHLDFRGQTETSIEREANAYAADLLMPYWMIKFLGSPLKNNPVDLARMFEVSEAAMLYRLKSLGFVPGYRRSI